MIFAQSPKFRRINQITVISLLLITAVCICPAQETNKQDSAKGELKIEGKYIERLVLRQRDGRTQSLDHPDEIVKLPVGEYHLLETHLIDGYSCRSNRTPSGDWVTIAEDRPAVLKLGAPLTQTVKVKRRGSALILNYELLGGGGEIYTSSDRSKPPTFTIYKGDKEIASGKFEFG
ncbi:MAG: hypothetical protein H8D56_12650 [Planctomycetes bacterium]|nr:hypothetical protein [Planctomycetota bacterium]MBL7143836.1 hypothetical protein [Phycisphaerae bacterium]